MAFDKSLIDEYARSQAARKQYEQAGRKDLADNADRYKLQIAQKLAQQGFKVDPKADLSGDYISKHGENAGRYDTSQKGQVAITSKRDRNSDSSNRSVDWNKMAIAKASLNLDPTAESSYKDDNGEERVRLLPMLRYLTEGKQSEISNNFNVRDFAARQAQQQLENDQAERAFTAQQQQQQYANRQAEMARNIGLAESFAERYGMAIDPKSDYRYLNEQVRGLKPLNVQQMEAQERERQSAERARQQGISLDWARLADSRADRATDNKRQAATQDQQRLFDIWEITGVAPAGIPGVKPGTPIYQKPKAESQPSYDEAMAKAISLANQDPDWEMLDPAGRKQLIQGYFDQISVGSGGAPSDDDIYEYLR